MSDLIAKLHESASDTCSPGGCCYADTMQEAAAELTRLQHSNAALVERMNDLLLNARLLQQNAEGCAVNHYGEDFEQQGLPGWLVDTQKSIDAAQSALAQSAERT